MELVIFIVFQLLMEVQSYKSPTMKVSPDVIRESSSVKISCETPADVIANQCYFYTNREEKNIKVSSSCELELTGAEVLRWADVKPPVSIYINCYYTIHERGINKPSSDSPPATVTVLDSLQKPTISGNDDDVQPVISCEIPLSVRADFICSLYTEDDDLLSQRVSQWSQSGGNLCMFYLSQSELFPRSVNSRQLICVYSLKTEPELRSPHSDTYTIRDLPQAKLRASKSFILETDTVELSCENSENLKMDICYFNIIGRERNSKQSSSCQLSLTGSQISIWSGDQSSSVTIACFYTVMKKQVQKPSDHSDPLTVRVQKRLDPEFTEEVTHDVKLNKQILSTVSTSTTTEKTTTTMKTTLTIMSTSETTTYIDHHSKTNLPTSTAKETMPTSTPKTSPLDNIISTSETSVSRRTDYPRCASSISHTEGPATASYKDVWFIVLVSTGVAVILSGLMGFICLCWFASKKRRKHQGPGMSCSGPAETYSLITSVPATSQPISGDVLINKQQEHQNPEDNENVYHLYCTIPDKPVHSNAEDHLYSLVKMN